MCHALTVRAAANYGLHRIDLVEVPPRVSPLDHTPPWGALERGPLVSRRTLHLPLLRGYRPITCWLGRIRTYMMNTLTGC